MFGLMQHAASMDLSRSESQVHIALTSFLYYDSTTGRHKSECFPSHGELARLTKLSKSAVRKALYGLRDKGFWLIEKRHGPDSEHDWSPKRQTTNRYLAGPWLRVWEDQKLSTRVSTSEQGGCLPANRDPCSPAGTLLKNKERKKKTRARENSSPSAACALGAPPQPTHGYGKNYDASGTLTKVGSSRVLVELQALANKRKTE